MMPRRSGRSWLAGWLGVLALGVALGYVFFPVRVMIEGTGTIEPLFEDLVLITTDVSGMITRMRVGLHQDVERGAPLFEYLADGQWAVQGRAVMSKPSDAPPEPPPAPPEWYTVGNQRKVARVEAMSRWSKRFVYSTARKPLAWESLLRQRLNEKVIGEDDVAMEEARAAENVQLGHPEFNLAHAFDQSIGMIRATEDGQPFPSAVAGVVYSLWVRQRSQFSRVRALGEIWRPETPLEVFGLVPAPPASLRDLPGWRAGLAAPGEAAPAPLTVTSIEFGRVPIDAGDARLIFPSLPVTRESVFVRLRLAEAPDRERLGAPLLITLTSPARPRLWLWLGGR
jgi:hypothetical protein